MESEVDPSEILSFKRYVERLEGSWGFVRAEIGPISERLRFATSHRDTHAHARAYRDLYNLVKKQLSRLPDRPPDFPLFSKPEPAARAINRAIKTGGPLPLVNYVGTVFMGCPWCEGWIDITGVFTKGVFDGSYACDGEQRHSVVFQGTTNPKLEESQHVA